MKKIITALATAALLVACTSEYDDSAILEKIAGLETRVTALENNVSALQSAIGEGKFVQKVEAYVDPDTGKTTGVTVTYTTGEVKHFSIEPATDYAGPVLSVMKNGAGDLCWAVDGVILQLNGEDVPIYQTPVFTIDEDGNLWVEVNGKKAMVGTVQSGGATLQDGIFTNLEVTDTAVVLTLSDNTTVNIPFATAFKLNIGTTEFEYNTLDPISIPYTVSAKTASTVVGVSGYNPKAFKVEVDESKIVITPLKLTESAVLLAYADSKVGLTSFVNITIEAEEVEVGAENLGKKESANCYIVTAAGEYKFPAVKGNSSESVGAVASAATLWETWNDESDVTAGSVITSVSCADGFVNFEVPEGFHTGNAVIAAKDAAGVILWSWHIWVPETEVQILSNGLLSTAIMDRNLGALVVAEASTEAAVDVRSFGLLYQWGRKDPSVGAKRVKSSSNATVAGEALSAPGLGTMTVEESIKNPTVWYSQENSTWLTEPDNTLWQDGEKTMYDPCPPGYRVPARDTSMPFFASDLSTNTGWAENGTGCWFTMGDPAAVFPFAGYRDDYGVGSVAHAYDRVFLWSAHNNGDTKGYGIDIRLGSRHQYSSAPMSRGAVVRCAVTPAE